MMFRADFRNGQGWRCPAFNHNEPLRFVIGYNASKGYAVVEDKYGRRGYAFC